MNRILAERRQEGLFETWMARRWSVGSIGCMTMCGAGALREELSLRSSETSHSRLNVVQACGKYSISSAS